jgi:ATP-dependent phosphofructokinase / diphosphate-dependent phosphofructokinase
MGHLRHGPARHYEDDAPHLIYTPERPPSIEQICNDVLRCVSRIGRAVVAVCEGLRDRSGDPFGADVDRPGSKKHELASNLAHTLAKEVNRCTGVRTRSEKPGLLGRACSFSVSPVDAEEAYRCGLAAVDAGLQGQTGRMIAFHRNSHHPYRCDLASVPLAEVVGERLVPAEWIHPAGNDVTGEFLKYVRPLAGEIPRHARL